MAVLAGLYVYDSALLLTHNEVLLTRTQGGPWKAIFSIRGGSFFGRELCLGNLLCPARPVFRLRWHYETPLTGITCDLASVCEPLRPFAFLIAGLFATMLIALPAVLLLRLGDLAVVFVFALMYLQILATCLVLWRYRKPLNLSTRQVASMCFEFVLCPPFALNAVRRLTLAQQVREDFYSAAQRLLSPQAFEQACQQLLMRLDDEIMAEAEGTLRMQALVERVAALEKICLR